MGFQEICIQDCVETFIESCRFNPHHKLSEFLNFPWECVCWRKNRGRRNVRNRIWVYCFHASSEHKPKNSHRHIILQTCSHWHANLQRDFSKVPSRGATYPLRSGKSPPDPSLLAARRHWSTSTAQGSGLIAGTRLWARACGIWHEHTPLQVGEVPQSWNYSSLFLSL